MPAICTGSVIYSVAEDLDITWQQRLFVRMGVVGCVHKHGTAKGSVCSFLVGCVVVCIMLPVQVIVLLNTCGSYFSKGAAKRRLDRFLTFLQVSGAGGGAVGWWCRVCVHPGGGSLCLCVTMGLFWRLMGVPFVAQCSISD